jgi:hypothetical protein
VARKEEEAEAEEEEEQQAAAEEEAAGPRGSIFDRLGKGRRAGDSATATAQPRRGEWVGILRGWL